MIVMDQSCPSLCLLNMQTIESKHSFDLLICFRGGGEELQARSRGQNPEYHHGHEGAHEDKGEEPTGSVRGDPGDVSGLKGRSHQPSEDSQAGCAGWDLQVVRQNQHHRSVWFLSFSY